MNLLESLKRPEYIFRPAQIIRRLVCEFSPTPDGHQTVRLPWRLQIRILPTESLGSCIRRLGLYDLPSSECISRLIDPGDLVVDVGANIGHMTSIMAMRAGPEGKVIAIEPHPVIFTELQYNLAAWKKNAQAAPVVPCNLALSNYIGTAQLMVPSNFDENHGIACLATGDDPETNHRTVYHEVQVTTLDAVVAKGQRISFLKIDVEGHELQVLNGAQRLMECGSIRDILFEEQRTPPTPVTELLEDKGYTIYRLDGGFLGPIVASIKTPYMPIVCDAPNYLATRDCSRMIAKMSKKGWNALLGRL